LFGVTHQLARWGHPALMVLALIGTFFALKQGLNNPAAAIFGVVMLYFVVFHIIGAPFPRYAIPIRPICYGLAFFALQVFTEYLARSPWRKS
jgi:hypothetical protein